MKAVGMNKILLACVATLTLGAGAVSAQEWSSQVTLYGWGASVGGDLTPFTGAPTVSFEKSLSEVLEDLDAAFFATALARRGDLVLFGDLTYTSSSRSGLVPPGIPASGGVAIKSLTLAAGKRFQANADTTIDVMGGARAWKLDGRISSPILSVGPSESFVDPILALRVNTQLSDTWSVLSYVDVGGFGAGSDFTWQAAVTANYRVSAGTFLSLGWRHLEVDYTNRGTVFDGSMSGPVAGLTIQF